MKDLGFASISAVNQYLRYARNHQMDVDTLLEQAGLSSAMSQQSHGRIKGIAFQNLIAAMVDAANDPILGLKSSDYVQTESYDIMGPMVLNCSNLGEAIELIPRFERLVGDMGTTSIARRAEETVLTWQCAYPELSVRPHMVDNVLASWTQFARWLTQDNSSAHLITLRRPLPSPNIQAAYQRVFQCQVDFGAQQNSIYLDSSLLNTPISDFMTSLVKAQQQQTMIQQLKGKATSEMASLKLEDESFGDQIRRSIKAHLQLGSIQKSLIAEEHCMSERSLQRKLGQEGLSYQGLIDELRYERAKSMLALDQFSIADIAYNLGFQDERSFYRRFKIWSGNSPGEFRALSL